METSLIVIGACTVAGAVFHIAWRIWSSHSQLAAAVPTPAEGEPETLSAAASDESAVNPPADAIEGVAPHVEDAWASNRPLLDLPLLLPEDTASLASIAVARSKR
jgi:hypothetical protein